MAGIPGMPPGMGMGMGMGTGMAGNGIPGMPPGLGNIGNEGMVDGGSHHFMLPVPGLAVVEVVTALLPAVAGPGAGASAAAVTAAA
jgi:hypothetical protein